MCHEILIHSYCVSGLGQQDFVFRFWTYFKEKILNCLTNMRLVAQNSFTNCFHGRCRRYYDNSHGLCGKLPIHSPAASPHRNEIHVPWLKPIYYRHLSVVALLDLRSYYRRLELVLQVLIVSGRWVPMLRRNPLFDFHPWRRKQHLIPKRRYPCTKLPVTTFQFLVRLVTCDR
jgi:hypothetical protein